MKLSTEINIDVYGRPYHQIYWDIGGTKLIHDLKILPEYFDLVQSREKTFEIRKNDRNYQIGDIVVLKEWDLIKQEYTGRTVSRVITYILDDNTYLQNGYVALGIK